MALNGTYNDDVLDKYADEDDLYYPDIFDQLFELDLPKVQELVGILEEDLNLIGIQPAAQELVIAQHYNNKGTRLINALAGKKELVDWIIETNDFVTSKSPVLPTQVYHGDTFYFIHQKLDALRRALEVHSLYSTYYESLNKKLEEGSAATVTTIKPCKKALDKFSESPYEQYRKQWKEKVSSFSITRDLASLGLNFIAQTEKYIPVASWEKAVNEYLTFGSYDPNLFERGEMTEAGITVPIDLGSPIMKTSDGIDIHDTDDVKIIPPPEPEANDLLYKDDHRPDETVSANKQIFIKEFFERKQRPLIESALKEYSSLILQHQKTYYSEGAGKIFKKMQPWAQSALWMGVFIGISGGYRERSLEMAAAIQEVKDKYWDKGFAEENARLGRRRYRYAKQLEKWKKALRAGKYLQDGTGRGRALYWHTSWAKVAGYTIMSFEIFKLIKYANEGDWQSATDTSISLAAGFYLKTAGIPAIESALLAMFPNLATAFVGSGNLAGLLAAVLLVVAVQVVDSIRESVSESNIELVKALLDAERKWIEEICGIKINPNIYEQSMGTILVGQTNGLIEVGEEYRRGLLPAPKEPAGNDEVGNDEEDHRYAKKGESKTKKCETKINENPRKLFIAVVGNKDFGQGYDYENITKEDYERALSNYKGLTEPRNTPSGINGPVAESTAQRTQAMTDEEISRSRLANQSKKVIDVYASQLAKSKTTPGKDRAAADKNSRETTKSQKDVTSYMTKVRLSASQCDDIIKLLYLTTPNASSAAFNAYVTPDMIRDPGKLFQTPYPVQEINYDAIGLVVPASNPPKGLMHWAFVKGNEFSNAYYRMKRTQKPTMIERAGRFPYTYNLLGPAKTYLQKDPNSSFGYKLMGKSEHDNYVCGQLKNWANSLYAALEEDTPIELPIQGFGPIRTPEMWNLALENKFKNVQTNYNTVYHLLNFEDQIDQANCITELSWAPWQNAVSRGDSISAQRLRPESVPVPETDARVRKAYGTIIQTSATGKEVVSPSYALRRILSGVGYFRPDGTWVDKGSDREEVGPRATPIGTPAPYTAFLIYEYWETTWITTMTNISQVKYPWVFNQFLEIPKEMV